MKLSLRWVCDHLNIDWKKIAVPELVAWFNTAVAEIESFETSNIDLNDFAFGQITATAEGSMTLDVPEWKKSITLSTRTDAQQGSWYLIKRGDGSSRFAEDDSFEGFAWATPVDFAIDREGCLPAFQLDKQSATSDSWKKEVGQVDYILDVDNKSITHRPDLWSHRGFAREIAPFLGTTLRKEEDFLADVPVEAVKDNFKATKQFPLGISNAAKGCKRFAGLYFESIEQTPSSPVMAFRLMKVGQRPIDFLVDATNYVMFDIGQPLHAFDAAKVSGTIGPRLAKNGEQLTLLSDLNMTLQATDMVIADDTKALALAGIKGGQSSGVTAATKSLFLEAGTFAGGVVRLSTVFHGLRTEASTRFEKELDPHQNILGIQRFVKLLQDEGVAESHAPYIVSLGDLPKPLIIELSQSFIEKKLGLELATEEIVKKLEALDFKVAVDPHASSKGSLRMTSTKNNSEAWVPDALLGVTSSAKESFSTKCEDSQFTVTVPTYRATKDIKQKEDIVEEIARSIGYLRIPEKMPLFEQKPVTEQWVDRLRTLKNFLAYTGQLKELANYAFLDNDFLTKINWRVERPVVLANPLAEQRTTLVDSPVVPLLQNVADTEAVLDQAGFFEWARAWKTDEEHPKKVIERKTLAGIVYQRKGQIDFYAMKALLADLFKTVGLTVTFNACFERPRWAHRYKVTDLIVDGTVVGVAGSISTVLTNKLGIADAFAFDLDGDFLLTHNHSKIVCKALSKYQGSFLDISMMVPIACSVQTIEQIIGKADALITQVQLQDIFQKPEWIDSKAMTFRYFVQDPEQTVTKATLERAQAAVIKAVLSLGVTVR